MTKKENRDCLGKEEEKEVRVPYSMHLARALLLREKGICEERMNYYYFVWPETGAVDTIIVETKPNDFYDFRRLKKGEKWRRCLGV